MILFQFLIDIIESACLLLFINLVLKKKNKYGFIIFLIISSFFIILWDIKEYDYYILDCIDIITLAVYSIYLFKKKSVLHFILPVLSLSILYISNSFSILILTFLNFFNQTTQSVLSKLLFIILIYIFSIALDKMKVVNDKIMLYTSLCILSISFLNNNIVDLIFLENYTKKTPYILLLYTILAFLFFILLFTEAKKEQDKKHELELISAITQEKSIHYEDIEKNIASLNKIKHDFKHILISMQNDIHENNLENIKTTITNQLNQLSQVSLNQTTNNDLYDYIISIHQNMIKEKNIYLFKNITTKEIPINKSDFSILFGNLLDNAVEHCSSAIDKKIMITNGLFNEYYYLTIKNSITKSVLKNNPLLLSTKLNSYGHGIGINSCKDIVSRYQGTIQFSENNNYFIVKILFPNYNIMGSKVN